MITPKEGLPALALPTNVEYVESKGAARRKYRMYARSHWVTPDYTALQLKFRDQLRLHTIRDRAYAEARPTETTETAGTSSRRPTNRAVNDRLTKAFPFEAAVREPIANFCDALALLSNNEVYYRPKLHLVPREKPLAIELIACVWPISGSNDTLFNWNTGSLQHESRLSKPMTVREAVALFATNPSGQQMGIYATTSEGDIVGGIELLLDPYYSERTGLFKDKEWEILSEEMAVFQRRQAKHQPRLHRMLITNVGEGPSCDNLLTTGWTTKGKGGGTVGQFGDGFKSWMTVMNSQQAVYRHAMWETRGLRHFTYVHKNDGMPIYRMSRAMPSWSDRDNALKPYGFTVSFLIDMGTEWPRLSTAMSQFLNIVPPRYRVCTAAGEILLDHRMEQQTPVSINADGYYVCPVSTLAGKVQAEYNLFSVKLASRDRNSILPEVLRERLGSLYNAVLSGQYVLKIDRSGLAENDLSGLPQRLYEELCNLVNQCVATQTEETRHSTGSLSSVILEWDGLMAQADQLSDQAIRFLRSVICSRVVAGRMPVVGYVPYRSPVEKESDLFQIIWGVEDLSHRLVDRTTIFNHVSALEKIDAIFVAAPESEDNRLRDDLYNLVQVPLAMIFNDSPQGLRGFRCVHLPNIRTICLIVKDIVYVNASSTELTWVEVHGVRKINLLRIMHTSIFPALSRWSFCLPEMISEADLAEICFGDVISKVAQTHAKAPEAPKPEVKEEPKKVEVAVEAPKEAPPKKREREAEEEPPKKVRRVEPSPSNKCSVEAAKELLCSPVEAGAQMISSTEELPELQIENVATIAEEILQHPDCARLQFLAKLVEQICPESHVFLATLSEERSDWVSGANRGGIIAIHRQHVQEADLFAVFMTLMHELAHDYRQAHDSVFVQELHRLSEKHFAVAQGLIAEYA